MLNREKNFFFMKFSTLPIIETTLPADLGLRPHGSPAKRFLTKTTDFGVASGSGIHVFLASIT